jgi:Glycosyl hydrolase family 12
MQTLSYDGTSFKVESQSGGNATNGAPVSYPSTFIGSNHERATMGSNLPKQVSSLTTIPTAWSHNADGSQQGIYNASYDVWFSTAAMGDAEAPSGGYLMVWLYDPPNAQPIGGVMGGSSGVTIEGVPGTWDIWLGDNAGKPCISYLRTQPTQSMDFDLNVFIKDAVGRGAIQSAWYLTNVFAGFEIWAGGAGLESKSFHVSVN